MSAFRKPFRSNPFRRSGGGVSTAKFRDMEARFVWNNQMTWVMHGAISRLAGKEMDRAKSFPRGPNGGSYYPGAIAFVDGTVMTQP